MGCAKSKPAEPGASGSASPAKDGVAGTGGGGAGGANAETMKFLKQVELFKRFQTEEDFATLAKTAQKVEFKGQTIIIKQGDEGDEFFVLVSGSADVKIDDKKVADLKTGDYFGETALIRCENRNATITATADTSALKITRADFVQQGLIGKLEFKARGAVGAGVGADAVIKEASPKSTEERALMVEALRSNNNLTKLIALDEAKMNAIVDLMWKESVTSGTKVIEQDSLDADYFYIVQEGSFEVGIRDDGKKNAVQQANNCSTVGTISRGGSFGELALLYLAPRAATVTAKSNAIVWKIARTQFKMMLAKATEDDSASYVKYLDSCELLACLKDDEKKSLAKALDERFYNKGEAVMKQGEKGDYMHILIDGEAKVEIDGEEKATYKEVGKLFGEKALESGDPRQATVTVTSASAKTLVVDKQSFEMIIGPLKDVIARGKDGTGEIKKLNMNGAADTKRFGNIKKADLQILGLLGCGGFGAVHMVEHKPTQETYALKQLSKGYVVKSGMQQSVMSEKNVQLMCDSPFVVKVFETFNTNSHLELLLELALGGELYATYNKKQLYGKEAHAQFYVAGTVFAFEHLHGKKIIFRDLKPENLLLNEKGQVKLTDMGLAKVVVGKTYTTCGTPDYFAPELIASKGHTHAVDWWTLGILTFELMVGHPPFESATPMQIYQKVTKGINKISFPKRLGENFENIVKSLCHANPSERLPMKKGEAKNIKIHAWFGSFDWAGMEQLTMKPPYEPQVKSKKDKGNFNAKKEDMPPQIPYDPKKDKSGWDDGFATSS
jgi:serine/threonine protein kinase/CRP-like cAMP-binding protein